MPDALAVVLPFFFVFFFCFFFLFFVLFCFVCFVFVYFFASAFSVISCCRVLIVVSSLYSFDFYVLGIFALMGSKSFTQTKQMSCVHHGRAKGDGCGHVKSILAPPTPLLPPPTPPPPPPRRIFTDGSKTVLSALPFLLLCVFACMSWWNFYFG